METPLATLEISLRTLQSVAFNSKAVAYARKTLIADLRMLLLIDNTIEGIGSSPREIRAALQQIEPDLRAVTEPCANITAEFVKVLSRSHIILSAQSHPWDQYSPESLAGISHMIRTEPLPIVGLRG